VHYGPHRPKDKQKPEDIACRSLSDGRGVRYPDLDPSIQEIINKQPEAFPRATWREWYLEKRSSLRRALRKRWSDSPLRHWWKLNVTDRIDYLQGN
jgi:hypothetical protein